jgi:hypothetical protein
MAANAGNLLDVGVTSSATSSRPAALTGSGDDGLFLFVENLFTVSSNLRAAKEDALQRGM